MSWFFNFSHQPLKTFSFFFFTHNAFCFLSSSDVYGNKSQKTLIHKSGPFFFLNFHSFLVVLALIWIKPAPFRWMQLCITKWWEKSVITKKRCIVHFERKKTRKKKRDNHDKSRPYSVWIINLKIRLVWVQTDNRRGVTSSTAPPFSI